MGLQYKDLSQQVRQFMASELEIGTHHKTLAPHRGSLTVYVDDLREAAERYDDDWLAQRLLEEAVAVDRERQKRGDKAYWSFVNLAYAAQLTAEAEFNKLYIRGLCQFAILSGIKQVKVYQAKAITATPPGPNGLLEQVLDPESLLNLLRGDKAAAHSTTLSEADFADSGLSVRLPQRAGCGDTA